MKIAILGSNGFIGNSITAHLREKYTVTPVSRKTLNLLNPLEVKEFLKANYFDVVINTATIMTDNLGIQDARNNLGLFMNFYNNSTYFGKFINTGSGAEFDRSLNIDRAKEENIFNVLPQDSYGFGQNLKSRLCYDRDNFYTLRIFNCFGNGELTTRIFPKLLSAIDQFSITNDRYFDYFSIQDLLKVIDHGIINDWNVPDINCVYDEKYKISDIAQKFIDMHDLDIDLCIDSISEYNYTGDSTKLSTLGVALNGLSYGLKSYVGK